MPSILSFLTLLTPILTLDTTCTFHAQHYGTKSISAESNLHHLGCADELVGWGKDGVVAAQESADMVRPMKEFITSSSLGGAYGCGAGGAGGCEFVMVVDRGGSMLDLHPEIFYRLFGVDETAPTAETYWADDAAAQRYKGMGGEPACQVEAVDKSNCRGSGPSKPPKEEPKPVPKPEPEPPVKTEPAPVPKPDPVPEVPDTPEAPEKPAPEYEPEAPVAPPKPSSEPTPKSTPAPTPAPIPEHSAESPCHTTGITCVTSDPTSLYLCTGIKLFQFDVAPGTECRCKDGGWKEGDECEGEIHHASLVTGI